MEFKYVVENGEVIIIGYSDITVEHIIIPEFIDGLPVTTIDSCSFSYTRNLKTITIPTTIKNISTYAFGDLHNVMINDIIITDTHIINNKFVIDGVNLLTITKQIKSDYILKSDLNNYYLIGTTLYDDLFKKLIKMEIC